MKPSETLISGLRKQGLLPAGAPDIGNYYELEAQILTYVASLPDKPSSVVWFDGECIENKGDYFGLLGEFIRAADCGSDVEILRCEVDFDGGVADCEVSRQGALMKASWAQDSDWVTSEFLEFTASLLNSEKGAFVDIATGDQTYFALFLPFELLKKFDQFRDRDTKSRDGFFMQHGEAIKQRYGNRKILPIRDYRAVMRGFRSSFIEDGPVSKIASYRNDKAIEIVYCGRWSDAQDAYRNIKRLGLDTELYADVNQWEYEAVCPDEACYFLSCDSAYDQVIFAEEAHYLPTLIGTFPTDKNVGEYLVIGKNGGWGLCVKEHSVICVGEPSISLAEGISKSIRGNQNAKYFDRFVDDHYSPLLTESAYDGGMNNYRDFYLRDDGELRIAFLISASQKDIHDPLEVVISVRLFSYRIASMLGEDSGVPKSLARYVARFPGDSPKNRWLIECEGAYSRQAAKMRTFIEENVRWAKGIGVDDELMKLYQDDEMIMHAAAVAIELGDVDQAHRLARLGLDAAQETGPKAGERILKMAQALGIELAAGDRNE